MYHIQHTFDDCPLRSFGCITTTDTSPYRILDLDIEALDLFLTGYRYDHHHQGQPPQSPQEEHSPYDFPLDHHEHHEQRMHARAKALRFLTGLNMADVLLPDTQSCLTTPPSASMASLSDECSLQPFIVSEDAILSNDNERCSSMKTAQTRHVHACIHYSPTGLDDSNSCNNAHISDFNSTSRGYRFYLIKDVTEMHSLAIAARNSIRVSGRLGQRQQPFLTRHLRYHHPSKCDGNGNTKETSSFPTGASSNVLDDLSWGTVSVGPTTSSPFPVADPGLLIIQVTRFGTIDHAFAIPQLGQEEGKSLSQSWPDQPLFLAQDKAAIEAMASNALMAYVHPKDLPSLCKGLNQVCKSLYTVFRARWRVDALPELFSEDEDDESDESDEEMDALVECASRTIEFQGELFEEWLDPSATSGRQMSPHGSEEYAWTEVTGVLSNGNPVLVVRPLTMPEIEEEDSSLMMSALSKALNISCTTFVDVESEDDDGYLDMEMDLDMDMELDQALITAEMASVETKPQKDLVRRRMDLDLGEGLCLSQSNVQGLSDLRVISVSPSSTATFVSQCRRSSQFYQSNGQPLFLAFSPIMRFTTWPGLSSVVLDAWKEWVQTVQLTREQFQAWCEYLLDMAFNQTMTAVSFGMALMGCETLVLSPSSYPFLFQNWPPMQRKQQKEQAQQTWTIPSEDSEPCVKSQCFEPSQQATLSAECSSAKLSGIGRAGKVLEANCPALEGVVRQIGSSWIGQRIIVTSRLDQKLDVVADHVVDWWESEDRVAALTTSVPLLNTLTTYTPLGYLVTKMKR
ncbi:hypothetical protein EDD21DRAFT_372476 [Dissophora ornata]|nr:hypothetical protein BGZ58_001764 [Dissophora ornata]KAI8602212.1 hypothetical protein EDD21DRAFT_372476 [Dissophora ornata]